MKIRLEEVAAKAGVGLATVDRVLNRRGGVTPATERRVIEAARQLGWVRDLPALYRTGIRIEVLLGHPETRLYAGINAAIDRLIPKVERGVIIQRRLIDHTRPEAFARALIETKANAIIVHAQQDRAIIEAVRNRAAAGVPVITLVSDLPESQRLAYVGIDHRKAGRAAAFLLARMAKTEGFAVFRHSSAYSAHDQRIEGFREGLALHCPGHRSLRILEKCDDARSTLRALEQALAQDLGIGAVYNSGAANHVIEQALGTLPGRSLTFVGHDFAGDAHPMLTSGLMAAAIGERIDHQVQQAAEILLNHFGFTDHMLPRPQTAFSVLLAENIE